MSRSHRTETADRLVGVKVGRTYTEVDFASFRHFFRQDPEEFQHAISRRTPQRGAHRRQYVFPLRHLNGEAGQTHTQLGLNRSWPGRVRRKETEHGVPECWYRFARKLIEIEDNLSEMKDQCSELPADGERETSPHYLSLQCGRCEQLRFDGDVQ